MNNYKVLIISIIVLAVVNLGTLGFIWSKSQKKHKYKEMKMCCKDQKQGCNMDKHCEKGNKKCDGMKGHHKKGKGSMMSGKLISKRLNFSDEQQEKLKTLSENHFDKIKGFHNKKKELKKELIALLKDESNTEKRANLITQSTNLEKEILLHKMNHFSEIKKICTSEQKEKFYDLIENMERKMHHK